MEKVLKSQWFLFGAALLLGAIIMSLPRPEGTQFTIIGDPAKALVKSVGNYFTVVEPKLKSADTKTYELQIKAKETIESPADYLEKAADASGMNNVEVKYKDGLSPKAMRFLAILAVLIVLFVTEPIPLEITAILIGVSLVVFGIADVKEAWAPYMHPVVVFIMCCLIFAIAVEKAGLTKRLGYFIVSKAGDSVVRFTFIICIGLGLASAVMHDAAACAIGIVTMVPLMKASGIEPHSNTAKFMMLSLPFACSSGGMGSLIGGGRCMVSAAFLKEFTGIEITFFDWIKFAMPAAMLTVPVAVLVVYFVFRPDKSIKLPAFEEKIQPWTSLEKKTLAIIGLLFVSWLTKSFHGLDYSITGMIGVAILVFSGVLKWDDIHQNLEWGTALFIFGGGLSLGLGMANTGAADYFAYLFFPLIQGKGWLVLFVGVAVFGALVTNAMANVAAAALVLPIVIPMAQLEGIDPRILALCMGMGTSFALLLVIGCPPNAIAYSYRYFKSSDLTKAGAVATPILIGVLVLVAAVWWRILGLV